MSNGVCLYKLAAKAPGGHGGYFYDMKSKFLSV